MHLTVIGAITHMSPYILKVCELSYCVWRFQFFSSSVQYPAMGVALYPFTAHAGVMVGATFSAKKLTEAM